MDPTVGRIVHYRPHPGDPPGVLHNSPEFLPAIITWVGYKSGRVNLKVFCDGPGIVHMESIAAGNAPGQWQWPRIE